MDFQTPQKKKMPVERKIFGIPIIRFAVILALFLIVIYFASGYASENAKLLVKYEFSKEKILRMSSIIKKLDTKQKMCESQRQTYEDSNRDLTLKESRSVKAKQQAEAQSDNCERRLEPLQKFYFRLKVYTYFLSLFSVI